MASLNDEIVRLMADLALLEEEAAPIKDYGKSSGICVDRDRIRQDMETLANMMILRVSDLRRRIELLKKESDRASGVRIWEG